MNKTAERALLVRPLAVCLGAAALYGLNPLLRADAFILALALLSGVPNFVLWVMRNSGSLGTFAVGASPVIGLLGWGALATFTQGLKSPMMAAFFFEVGLAAVSMTPRGVVGVTLAAIAVVFGIQSLFGLAAGWQLLLFETGFLAVMGVLAYVIAGRRVASEDALRVQRDELGGRLEVLQRQLEGERVVSRVGENVARLAHGLKNAVHSLRGFVALIEPAVERRGASREALVGLRAAIDDLERLARLTLADEAPGAAAGKSAATAPAAPAAGIAAIVEAAIQEVGTASPATLFEVAVAPAARGTAVRLGEAPLRELLAVLLRNAVEAMHGSGRCSVGIARDGGSCRVEIADEGEGLAPDAEARLFTPGYTTRPGGSGFGLFLARRLVEDNGGTLVLTAGKERGAIAVLTLPVEEAAGDPPGIDAAAGERTR